MSEPDDGFPFAFRCASRLVAAVYDLEPALFTNPRKGAPAVVYARQVLAYLLYTEGDFALVRIAEPLGRHHSTVGHSVRVITTLRDDPDADDAFGRLGQMYRDLVAAHERLPSMLKDLAA